MSEVLRQLRAEQTKSIGARPRLMQRFEAFLPITEATPTLSLGEGFTPLVHARTLGRAMGCPLLFLKFEGMNPTGSFKDRGMVLAVAKALEAGADAIICASTGNTAASAAAYGASAGMEVVVVLPGRPDRRRASWSRRRSAGARVVGIQGNFDDALRVVREMSEHQDPEHPVTLVNSVNPYRLEGQKTAAFEVCEDLGGAPRLPRHPGRQCRQHQRLLAGLHRVPRRRPGGDGAGDARLPGRRAPRRWSSATRSTIRRPSQRPSASAIPPAPRRPCARATSRAAASRPVTDEEILDAYRDLARHEGVFCEPASAASVAGIRKLAAEGAIDPGRRSCACSPGTA